ncbi:MAG: PepSY domain-containing protein [Saprospiraceae bacterium]|nr:PepSY domain-containing protein [Saprospiraceae bacterium]
MHQQTEHLASKTRTFRRLHRFVAVPMFGFMFLIGLTGVLLGWKKQTGIAPPTLNGSNANPSTWISLDSIQKIATARASTLNLDPAVDRIDIRPDKGIAKVVFAKHYTELQIDCASGKLLSEEARLHDFVEHLHDGTIIDRLLGTKNDPVKTTYTTITSLALMTLSFTGFWMWLNPRRMRKMKANP